MKLKWEAQGNRTSLTIHELKRVPDIILVSTSAGPTDLF
jgi:hypothetical protein